MAIMKRLVLILLLFTYLTSSCASPKTANVSNNTPTPTPSPSPAKVEYKTPQRGMTLFDFMQLCKFDKDQTPDDDVSTSNSDAGKVKIIRLGRSKTRETNECWGHFTFVNEKLETILR